MGWMQNKFEKNFLITTVDYVFNWARKSAVWPMTFGLACCAIEMIASSTARFDIARFGSEVFRPSPRQSDLMIVAGTVTLKMAPVVKRIAPAVVNVYARSIVQQQVNPFFNDPLFGQLFGTPEMRQRVQQSLGSGVIVRADGLIVTNNHVVEGGTDIVSVFD